MSKREDLISAARSLVRGSAGRERELIVRGEKSIIVAADLVDALAAALLAFEAARNAQLAAAGLVTGPDGCVGKAERAFSGC